MKEKKDLIIVMPVGPAANTEFIKDSLSSVHHYIRSSYQVILADDSQKGTGEEIKGYFPEIDILTIKKNLGKTGGLYINLSNAYKHALYRYDFKALLKMDDDAL